MSERLGNRAINQKGAGSIPVCVSLCKSLHPTCLTKFKLQITNYREISLFCYAFLDKINKY